MKRLQESKKLKTTHLLNNNSIHINKLSQLYIIKVKRFQIWIVREKIIQMLRSDQ